MAKNPNLAGQICLRQRLMDVYISHSSNFMPPSYTCSNLTKTGIYEMIIKAQERSTTSVRFSSGITEQVSFRLEAMINDSPTLTLTVTGYERTYPGTGLSGSYTAPIAWHPPATECRAILPDSVPSIEQLENLSRPGICKLHDPFLSHDLHDKIDRVLLLYSEGSPLVRAPSTENSPY